MSVDNQKPSLTIDEILRLDGNLAVRCTFTNPGDFVGPSLHPYVEVFNDQGQVTCRQRTMPKGALLQIEHDFYMTDVAVVAEGKHPDSVLIELNGSDMYGFNDGSVRAYVPCSIIADKRAATVAA